MSARFISLFIASLLHGAVFVATSGLSLSTQVTRQPVSDSLHITLIKPKQNVIPDKTGVESEPKPEPEPKLIKDSLPLDQIKPPQNTHDVLAVQKSATQSIIPLKETLPKKAPIKKKKIAKKRKPEPIVKPPNPSIVKANPIETPVNIEVQPAVVALAKERQTVVVEQLPVKPTTDELEAEYKQALVQAISRYKKYPRAEQRRGNEGSVQVGFTLLSDGRITKVSIAETSGWRNFDRAAMKSLDRLRQFKPIPSALKRNTWDLVIRIQFSLE